MKTLKKLDAWIFENISTIVRAWVKKKKYQEHKYDFFIMLHNWEISYLAAVIFFIVGYGAYKHHGADTILLASVMTVLFGLGEGMRRLLLNDLKARHDILFAHRKNPEVYKIVKEMNEHLYEYGWSHRKFILPLSILFLVYVLVSPPPFVAPVFIFNIISLYENYIFDFDDPEKKDKKEKDSVTDIVKNAWKNLIGDLVPKGI